MESRSSGRTEGVRDGISAQERQGCGVPAACACERGSGNEGADPDPCVRGAGRGRGGDRVGSVVGHSECCAGLGRRSARHGDPIAKVLAFHAENRGAVAFAVGSEALNLPRLLVFVTGLHGLVGRRGGAGADWSRLAVAAGATFAAVFALYAVLWNGVVLSADELAKPSPLFELVWQLHAGAFALALSAVGTTFI